MRRKAGATGFFSERTLAAYLAVSDHRISRVTDVEIEGIALKDWPLREYDAATPSPWSTTC